MKKILVVVDMQNDFIDGALGTPEARAIVPNVCRKIREGEWDYIYATMDTHNEEYMDTQEGKKLPVKHCIITEEEYDGWSLNEKIRNALEYVEKYMTHLKTTFGAIDLGRSIELSHGKDLEITLVGVCTDICVISNALLLKSHFPEARIVVDASCCAGSTPEKHLMALEVMRSCQIDILND